MFGEESRDGVAGPGGRCATGSTGSGRGREEDEFGPDLTGVINGESDWPRTKGLSQEEATGDVNPGGGRCATSSGRNDQGDGEEQGRARRDW